MVFTKERNTVAVVLLYLFTCGIYAIYLYFALFSEIRNEATRQGIVNNIMSPVLALLLSIITCGIFYYFYAYKAATIVQQLNHNYNRQSTDPVIVLILSIFIGIGIFFITHDASEYTKLTYRNNNGFYQ